MESPEISSYIYGQLSFYNGAKSIQWGKNSVFNKWCWDHWISTCEIRKFHSYLMPYTKINCKWINNLNIRAKTIDLLDENVGVNLYDTGFGNRCLDMASKAWATKEKNRLIGLHQNVKALCMKGYFQKGEKTVY